MNPTLRGVALIATVQIFSISILSAAPADDTIIVIGARTPVRINEIGSSAAVVSRDRIEQRQNVFIADLLQDVPGFSVSHAGGVGAQTQLRVRGAEANHVQVLINGIEANDIATGDEFRFAHLSSFDVERIEIVKGPQSALWGSDALAGVINVVTRKTQEGLAADAFVDRGAFSTVNLGGRIGAAGEKTNVDVAVSWYDTDGTNIARTGSEDDGYEHLTASVRASMGIVADKLIVDALIRHTDTTREFDELDFLTGLQVDADRDTDANQTYLGITTRLNLLKDIWQQSLRVTFADTADSNRTDGLWSSSASGEKFGVYYQSSFDLQSLTSVNQTVTVAVDHEQEDFVQRGLAGPFTDPNRNDDLDNTGYVLEYLVQPVEGLSLSLGLRHDDNSDFENATTYRATASYHFREIGARLRTSIGTGQKSPTFTERFGFFSDSSSNFVGNPNLKPEKSKAWEAGWDQDFGELTQLSLTYFNARLKDEIDGFFVLDPMTFAATAINRSGTSHRRGFEASGAVQPIDALTIRAQYTYADADEPGAMGRQMTEIRRPRHSGSLNVNYRFLDDRANTNLNLSYTGDQFDTDFSTFPATRVNLDRYTLVSIATSLALTDTVTLYGRVENLFDEGYENVYGFATPGIGAYIGARVQFRR